MGKNKSKKYFSKKQIKTKIVVVSYCHLRALISQVGNKPIKAIKIKVLILIYNFFVTKIKNTFTTKIKPA